MARIRLHEIAHARSGDKGDSSNVGIFVFTQEAYEVLLRELTEARVKTHFGPLVKGRVDRYELPNLFALNFILHDSLGGGGSESLKNDAQGKTHGQALLLMEIDSRSDPPRYPARTAGPPPPPGGKIRLSRPCAFRAKTTRRDARHPPVNALGRGSSRTSARRRARGDARARAVVAAEGLLRRSGPQGSAGA
jgi:hypothetical protein